MSETHECKPSRVCRCSVTGIEPNWECPVHGEGPWPPRCGDCGKFLPVEAVSPSPAGTP